MTELWAAIPGTNGKIEVSSDGRVRSLLRGCRILKATPDSKGYLRIRVTISRKKMSFKVHREVAKAFLPNPSSKPQVNHIDGNKKNNSISNLEWVTNKENAHHAIQNGLFNAVYAAATVSNNRRKRPITAKHTKTGEVLQFESVSAAERAFNSRHISDVLKNKRSNVKGWHFVYGEVIA